jgi:glucose/mannose transport system permease protein
MALFLAGLRSVDGEIIKAAQIDGAGAWRIYRRVVLPTMGPIVLAVMVILLQMAIKTFDLVRALTGGGPGIATNMPATVVYDFMFQRGQIGRGAAAAMLMLLALVVVIVPYQLYQRWRGRSA